MSAAENYKDLFADDAPLKHQLLEIHRSKISLHHAKEGYDDPTIRLPRTLSKLAGQCMCIYQTMCDGAPAFLIVVSQSGGTDKNELKENAAESLKKPVNGLQCYIQ